MSKKKAPKIKISGKIFVKKKAQKQKVKKTVKKKAPCQKKGIKKGTPGVYSPLVPKNTNIAPILSVKTTGI